MPATPLARYASLNNFVELTRSLGLDPAAMVRDAGLDPAGPRRPGPVGACHGDRGPARTRGSRFRARGPRHPARRAPPLLQPRAAQPGRPRGAGRTQCTADPHPVRAPVQRGSAYPPRRGGRHRDDPHPARPARDPAPPVHRTGRRCAVPPDARVPRPDLATRRGRLHPPPAAPRHDPSSGARAGRAVRRGLRRAPRARPRPRRAQRHVGSDPARLPRQFLGSIETGQRATTPDRVRELVELLLPTGRCSVEHVARSLGVDRRTVHRRLASEGQTFTSLVDATRRDLAARLVRGQNRPLTEVAEMLGFSSHSNFTRWFRSRFGCSPSQWRRAA